MYGSLENQQKKNPWSSINNPDYSQSSGSGLTCDPIGCLQIMFPEYSWKSFTFLNILLCWFVFFLTKLFYRVNDQLYPCVLYDFGANYGPDITYDLQFQRLILPLWLHADFFHILFNSIGLLSFGFSSENYYGKLRFISLYILSGIGGNILSTINHPYSLAVGASTGLFGLCALRIFYLIENYYVLGENKKAIVYITLLITLANLANSMDNPQIDLWGHIGGLTIGLLYAFSMYKNDQLKYRIMKRISIITMVLLLIIGIYYILGRDILNLIFHDSFYCQK